MDRLSVYAQDDDSQESNSSSSSSDNSSASDEAGVNMAEVLKQQHQR